MGESFLAFGSWSLTPAACARHARYSEECAWQLGEHPLVIGGGSIIYRRNGEEEFVKGDVAKIYREHKGVEWDGSPRFGLQPYEQRKTPEDWIAKALQGKLQRMKDMEAKVMARLNMSQPFQKFSMHQPCPQIEKLKRKFEPD